MLSRLLGMSGYGVNGFQGFQEVDRCEMSFQIVGWTFCLAQRRIHLGKRCQKLV